MRYGVYDANGSLLRYEYIRLEDEPTVQGSLWNRANVLPDDLVALLGLPYEDPQIRHALIAHTGPIKIASYEAAGAYQWTAPDLIDGKPYKIGVLIIGGGGSGCVNCISGSSTRYAGGGASGYSNTINAIVTPGDVFPLVVGKGGERNQGKYVVGKSGGTSSFNYVSVDGGGGGKAGSGETAYGAAPVQSQHTIYGLDRSASFSTYAIDIQRVNFFECKPMLGGGGSVYGATDIDGYFGTYPAGVNPLTGKGGGNAGGSATGGAIAEDATEPGCGGGGALSRTESYVSTSGAGADGAVYIYFLGVAAE